METQKNAKESFTTFIAKEKFVEQPYPNFYPGLTDKKMLPILTKKINQAALDFQTVATSKVPSEKKYQEKIKVGLSRFSDINLELDTEDRERICAYFEELMDIVELESSNGQLNSFMYGPIADFIEKK